MQKYQLTLTGISPLLMHWDNIEWQDHIKAGREAAKATANVPQASVGKSKKKKENDEKGDDRYPAHLWKGYLYNDGEHVAMPTDNLRSALVSAAKRVVMPDQKNKTYKELVAAGALFDDLYWPLIIGDGEPVSMEEVRKIDGSFADHAAAVVKLGFSLFVKRAAVGTTKHVRVRPRFETWSTTGIMTTVLDGLDEDVLQGLWDIVGPYIGLCDWRPGSKKSPGPFGRCKAEIKAL